MLLRVMLSGDAFGPFEVWFGSAFDTIGFVLSVPFPQSKISTLGLSGDLVRVGKQESIGFKCALACWMGVGDVGSLDGSRGGWSKTDDG